MYTTAMLERFEKCDKRGIATVNYIQERPSRLYTVLRSPQKVCDNLDVPLALLPVAHVSRFL